MIYGVYDNFGPEPDEVPVAKNFNGAYGLAEAMLESAKSEMAMFEAMLKVDAMEIKLNEQITTLKEAEAIGGSTPLAIEDKQAAKEELQKGTAAKVIEAIKKAIDWLIGKLKAAATAIYKKFTELIDRDGKMIKKHASALMHNADVVNKVEIKWAKVNKSVFSSNAIMSKEDFSYSGAVSQYKEDASARKEYYGLVEPKTYIDDEATDTTIGAAGGIQMMLHYVANGKKEIANFVKKIDELSKKLKAEAKSIKADKKTHPEEGAKVYKMFNSYKEVVLKNMRTAQGCMVKEYKQARAAVVKAIGSVAKTEATILAYMVEEAEYEVDDIFDTQIEKDPADVETVSAAPADILDTDVSNDPAAIEYDKVESYSNESSIDFFSQPLF